jgi:adenosylcobinamide-GDP ribazoletransferase
MMKAFFKHAFFSAPSLNRIFENFFVPCLMAIALLTRLPVTRFLPQNWRDKSLGQSALWYPFVGLLLGFLLTVVVMFLPAQTAPIIIAILIVTLWVLLTGALHLDGLADCVDAMYAAHAVVEKEQSHENKYLSEKQSLLGDRECPKKQTLFRVLKDPNVGSMAVVSLVLLLLIKVSVVSVSSQLVLSLFIAIVLSRAIALAFIISTPYTPYSSKAGLGAVLASCTPKKTSIIILIIVLVGLLFVLPVSEFCILLAVQFILFYFWRRYWLKKLDGFVGDVVGALIEISEATLLLTLYFLFL